MDCGVEQVVLAESSSSLLDNFFRGNIGILLLQKHNIVEPFVSCFGKNLAGQSETFWFSSLGTEGRSIGVHMSVGDTWLIHLHDHGILVPRTAIRISLHMGNVSMIP